MVGVRSLLKINLAAISFGRVLLVMCLSMITAYFVVSIFVRFVPNWLVNSSEFSTRLPIVSYTLSLISNDPSSFGPTKLIVTSAVFLVLFAVGSIFMIISGMTTIQKDLPFSQSLEVFWTVLGFCLIGYFLLFHPSYFDTNSRLSFLTIHSDFRYLVFLGCSFFAQYVLFMCGQYLKKFIWGDSNE